MSKLSDRDIALSVSALARAYYSSSKILLRSGGGEQVVPAIYLLGHSLELIIKSYLIFRGVPEKALAKREYGHNIICCLKFAKLHGISEYITISFKEAKQIAMIDRYYKGKKLEYYYPISKSFGSIEELEIIVQRIIEEIDEILVRSVFSELKNAT